jgi:putative transposase
MGMKAARRCWQIVALETTPDHVHLFVNAHRSDSPSRVPGQFQGFTSRYLQAGFAHLGSRLPAPRSGSCFAVTAGALPTQMVRWYTGTQDERPWRKERAR